MLYGINSLIKLHLCLLAKLRHYPVAHLSDVHCGSLDCVGNTGHYLSLLGSNVPRPLELDRNLVEGYNLKRPSFVIGESNGRSLR